MTRCTSPVAVLAVLLLWGGPLPATGQVAIDPPAANPVLTLEQVLALAQRNEPAFAAALAESRVASLERSNARAALLPTATYHNQAIYTQRNGVPASRIGQTSGAPSPIFIANNAIREYASQGVFNETVGFAQVAAIRMADASNARAAAELEVQRRGLASAVVALFYGVDATERKLEVATEAMQEADRFVDLAKKREAAREAAHADALKAQLQQQQRRRDVADAEVARNKARVELGALLFADPLTPFTLKNEEARLLPERSGIDALARQNNPELRSALASLQVSQAETDTARAALLPDLSLNFTYGIDATNFGVNGPDGIRNLGYAMSAAVDIPVWDWLSTERRIKAARLRQTAAQVAVTAAQRRLLANLAQFYAEASVAGSQLASLQESVVTAREALRLIRLRYVDGESTALDVTDAENTLTATQTAQIDGGLRYRMALANLQTLTGTF